MNNCFVKQLKGSTNNNSLPFLNKLVFKPGAGNTIQFQMASNSPYTNLYAVGGSLTDNGGSPVSSPCSMATISIIKFTAATDEDYAYLDNKYLITDLRKLPTSDVEVIASCVNLVKLDVEASQSLYGDIAPLSRLSKLKDINLRYKDSLYGKFEDVIVGIINSGRISATSKSDGIQFTSLVTSTNITFNGSNDVLKNNNGYFLWEPAVGEGQYIIGYYALDDDSKLMEETISIDEDGNWEIVE